jgi:phosphoglycolate phosphatase
MTVARDLAGLIFDKDGTLFGFEDSWAAWTLTVIRSESAGDQSLARALEEVLGFDCTSMQFRPDSIVIAETVPTVAGRIVSLLPAVARRGLVERLNAAAESAPQVEAAPLVPLMEGFRERGLRLGLATNDSEAAARAHLGTAGVLRHFDFVAGYDSGHGAKPDPGPLLAFASTIATDPGRIAMVGDSRHDLIAGRAAGMITVGVLTGPADAATLKPYADVVLQSIAELPDWLGPR